MERPRAAWYRHPEDPTVARYWDGSAWAGEPRRVPPSTNQSDAGSASRTAEAAATREANRSLLLMDNAAKGSYSNYLRRAEPVNVAAQRPHRQGRPNKRPGVFATAVGVLIILGLLLAWRVLASDFGRTEFRGETCTSTANWFTGDEIDCSQEQEFPEMPDPFDSWDRRPEPPER